MIKLFKITAVLLVMSAVSGALASCSGGDEPNEIPPIDIPTQEKTVTLADCSATAVACTFIAYDNWRADVDASWCKASPAQGTEGDNRTVTLSVEANPTTEQRAAVLKIRSIAGPEIFATFTIVQPGREAVVVAGKPVQATSSQAVKLYDYLRSVYGVKTLSSTIANVNWNIAEAELVHEATGKWPAIATFDYIHLAWSPANWIDYSDTKVVEDWWNAGGIVSACWHWNVPCTEADMTTLGNMTCTPGNGKPNAEGGLTTTFRPGNIFVDGTWEKRFADESLSKIADMLLLLKDKGIPVIWRPLHEAAGNTYADWNTSHQPQAWFWWGRDGAETYVRLWRYMFDYFGSRGLDNLIWVFTGDTRDGAFYPGDEYVDIVGCDMYNVSSAKQIATQYDGVAAIYTHKMVTLSEMGNLATISAQWAAGARWLYFMPWYHYDVNSLDNHQHANTAWWTDAMSQDFVITREQLPKFPTRHSSPTTRQ